MTIGSRARATNDATKALLQRWVREGEIFQESDAGAKQQATDDVRCVFDAAVAGGHLVWSDGTGGDPDAVAEDEATLDQFMAEVVATLADFAASYRRHRAGGEQDSDGNEIWPERLPLGDWWEQFTQHDPEADR